MWWLAGLLEGEGSFLAGPPSRPGQPAITLEMADEETVRRVAALMGSGVWPLKRHVDHPGWSPAWRTHLRGGRAYDLMQALRPIMSSRRQAQIDRAIGVIRRHQAPPGPAGRPVASSEKRVGGRGFEPPQPKPRLYRPLVSPVNSPPWGDRRDSNPLRPASQTGSSSASDRPQYPAEDSNPDSLFVGQALCL